MSSLLVARFLRCRRGITMVMDSNVPYHLTDAIRTGGAMTSCLTRNNSTSAILRWKTSPSLQFPIVRQFRTCVRTHSRRYDHLRRTSASVRRKLAEGKAKQQTPAATATVAAAQHAVDRYREIEEYLRVRGYNTLRWLLGISSGLAIILYIFRHAFKQELSEQVADVTTRSLDNENVVSKANELSKGIVQYILTDIEVRNQAIEFLHSLFQEPSVRDSVVVLLDQVVQQRQTQILLRDLVQTAIKDLHQQPETIAMLSKLVIDVLNYDSTREATAKLVNWAILQPSTVASSTKLIGNVTNDPWFREQALQLGIAITHGTLDDPAVQHHASHFVTTCLSDAELHQTGGDAIWEAVKYSMLPSFLRGRPDNQTTDDSRADDSSRDHHMESTDIQSEPEIPLIPEELPPPPPPSGDVPISVSDETENLRNEDSQSEDDNSYSHDESDDNADTSNSQHLTESFAEEYDLLKSLEAADDFQKGLLLLDDSPAEEETPRESDDCISERPSETDLLNLHRMRLDMKLNEKMQTRPSPRSPTPTAPTV